MSGKSNFLDYESLKNQRGEESSSEVEAGFKRVRQRETEEDFGITRKPPSSTSANDADELLPIEKEPDVVTPPISKPSTDFSLAAITLKSGHQISFAGLFIFTLLVFVRPYELTPSLAWLSKGALVTAIVTLLIFIPTQLGLENRLTLRTREVNMVLILLLLGLLSVPQAVDKLLAWNSFVEFLKVVAMFIVMVNVLRTRARLKLLWWLILVVSVGLSVKAIYDYRMGVLILGGDRIAGAIGGLFENPNDLALHLVTFLPIVIALAFATKNPFSKLVYLLAALTLVGGTVVTFSRGGFLGLIVVVATLAWRLMKQNRVLVLAAMVLLMGCFLVLSPGAYRQRISTTADDSATARTNELKRSIYVTIRHPLLGAGMDNFVVFSNTEHATHNAYTQVSSEIGIPAAVFYVLFLVAAVKRVKRIPHPREVDGKRKELAYLAIGIHASLVGYMVNSFFASVAYLWYVYYLVAYAICVWRLWEVDRSVESSSTS